MDMADLLVLADYCISVLLHLGMELLPISSLIARPVNCTLLGFDEDAFVSSSAPHHI